MVVKTIMVIDDDGGSRVKLCRIVVLAVPRSTLQHQTSGIGKLRPGRGSHICSEDEVQELNAASMQRLAYWSSSSWPMWLALLGCSAASD
jgi:hypothetical protein